MCLKEESSQVKAQGRTTTMLKQPSLKAKRDPTNRQPESQSPHQASLSLSFLLASASVAVLGPFLLGRYARSLLMIPQQASSRPTAQSLSFSSLPSPVIGTSQLLPATTEYTSKHFEAKGTASESFLVRTTPTEGATNMPQQDERATVNTSRLYSSIQTSEHLSSESQIVELLSKLVGQSKDTVLSYHCHKVSPQRISCAGIAAQGHIVLHTFPNHISLDTYGIELDANHARDILGHPLSVSHAPTKDGPASTQLHSDSSSAKAKQVTSAFVHPALFVHKSPKKVVLVGGSVTTVQQILLHNTVDRVILLDMDPLTEADCLPSCSTVEHVSQSATEWFRRGANATADVVFVESPNEALLKIVGAMKLYNDGLLVVKTKTWADKWLWINQLTDPNVGDIDILKKYQEAEFDFLVAFATDKSLGRWFASEAEVNLAIRERLGPPLPYFDGSTMLSYQYPSREAEHDFCSENPNDYTCTQGHGLDPSKDMIPISSFEVKLSTIPNAGRGVYAAHDADEGAYIFVDGCVHNIHIPDSAYWIIEDFVEGAYKNTSLSKWKTLMWYTSGYGFIADNYGHMAHDVDPGIGTFVNHGCNGTANVGSIFYVELTEYTDLRTFPIQDDERTIYNPAFDRTLRINACAESTALRRIQKGEEIFNNYMTFEDAAELEEYAESLRNECTGRQVGEISEYELSAQGQQILQQPPVQQLNASDAESCLQCKVMPELQLAQI